MRSHGGPRNTDGTAGPGGESGPEGPGGPIESQGPGSKWHFYAGGGRTGRSAPENTQSSVQSVEKDPSASQSASEKEEENKETQDKKFHFSLFHIGK